MHRPVNVATYAPDDIRLDMLRRIDRLIRTISCTQAIVDEIDLLREALAALPWTSGDYGIALNRLSNAQWFFDADERGAAKYELRLLAGKLRTEGAGPPARRRTGQRRAR